MRHALLLPLAASLAACAVVPHSYNVASVEGQAAPAAAPAPAPVPTPAPTPAPVAAAAPAPKPAPAALPPGVIRFAGELEQGGWIRGTAPVGTTSLMLDDTPVMLGDDLQFLAAFDRDAGGSATLTAKRSDGSVVTQPLTIKPRDWRIERINIARRTGGPSEAFMKIRRPELDQIHAARDMRTGADGWRQHFIWPVKGRISGLFGSQRIYRGEPGAYHSGLDVAPGAGVPFVSPADGTVVLAANDEFSLEGKLLIIDHGHGLNSAFLHAQELDVKLGDHVSQGQVLGKVGMSGRATGPHLHWSLMWQDKRLDPLLFTGPQN